MVVLLLGAGGGGGGGYNNYLISTHSIIKYWPSFHQNGKEARQKDMCLKVKKTD